MKGWMIAALAGCCATSLQAGLSLSLFRWRDNFNSGDSMIKRNSVAGLALLSLFAVPAMAATVLCFEVARQRRAGSSTVVSS